MKGTRDIRSGHSVGYRHMGRTPLWDRHAMLVHATRMQAYSTRSASFGAKLFWDGDSKETFTAPVPNVQCPDSAPSPQLYTTTGGPCGLSQTVHLWLPKGSMKSVAYTATKYNECIDRGASGMSPSECGWNEWQDSGYFRDLETALVNAGAIDGDWDLVYPANCLGNQWRASTNRPGRDVERSWGIVADGISDSGEDSEHLASNDSAQIHEFEPPYTTGVLIRDAFNPASAVSWYGWELLNERFRPGGYGEDPEWKHHGGIYSDQLMQKYPSPATFSSPGMRPVFVGVPYAC